MSETIIEFGRCVARLSTLASQLAVHHPNEYESLLINAKRIIGNSFDMVVQINEIVNHVPCEMNKMVIYQESRNDK